MWIVTTRCIWFPSGNTFHFENTLPFLAKFVPFDASLSAGEKQTIFQMTSDGQTLKFGVLICYEDTDSELARRLRQRRRRFSREHFQRCVVWFERTRSALCDSAFSRD